MDDMEQIREFAVKWCNKFKDPNIDYIELVGPYMGDDCDELDFEIDGGCAFEKEYGLAVNNSKELRRIIKRVKDVPLLGSAIYSRWRYFNHWAYSGAEILEPENRAWFILAISRLAVLAGKETGGQDRVDRVTVDYHRIKKFEGNAPVIWDYTEKLVLDRESETIEQIQNIGIGCVVSKKYYVQGGVEELLDGIDADDLFGEIEGNPDDVIVTPSESNDYTITVDFKKSPQRVIQGTYDKKGLPEFWGDFVEEVGHFIRFYGWGEMLDPAVYEKVRRRRGESIYCSVKFPWGNKKYYYIADEDHISVGDHVVVPVTKENKHVVGEVVKTEHFTKENAPIPFEQTKHIIRKCTDDDLDPPE